MSDTVLTFLFSAIVILAVFIPYIRSVRKRESDARERFRKMDIAGLQAATTMHPHIDVTQCIGCGGCVTACPEGDVLAVIDGRATLVHGSKCVGHGLCAEACPIGAITLLMAPPGRSADLPLLDANGETTVKNIFIAGELGGIGLIKNAAVQGKMVVEEICRRERAPQGIYDVAIVGAGPAGLVAALASLERGLRYVLLEQGDAGGTILQYPRRKIVMTSPVDIPLWGPLKLTSAPKERLLEIWQDILSKTGLVVHTNEKVLDITRDEGHFTIVTSQGNYGAAHVVLALGRRGTPRKLGVPGEQLSKVMYRMLDAESYKNTNVLVVGGGDSAIEAALGLALQKTNKVSLSYRKGEFSRIKQRNQEHLTRAVQNGSLAVIMNSEVREIREKEVVLSTPGGENTLKNDYVFVFAGGEMPFEFLKRVGVEFCAQVVE